MATRSARLVLVNSVFIHEQAKKIYGIDPIVSYHGVDTNTFYPNPERGTGSYVLSVGAIQPHKGYDFLIDSFSYLDERSRPSLHLVGNMKNSSEVDALRSLAKEKNVDLHIEVGIDQNTLVRKYNEAILVAYAPYNEPFGLVPLEAMACGKPVVGIREGGIKETVIDNCTGFLVDRDPKKFAEAVQTLMNNSSLADSFGRNGREQVLEKWSWEKSVSNLEQHFDSLIQ
jgi:glycosyltransferase involved in cell wall biosynthesis